MSTVLECLETLVQVGFLWLGASQYGSEIGAGEGVGSLDRREGAAVSQC